ncbi:MAG: putative DNA repair and recombination protein RAD54 [Streblomastix strix]|uniref:Putative DNA repair and recombination protein RAD54 n=1 Tax=Streblomastix strix TaxID=222440 RepID=A0A5J4X2B8_9EUKA|nr:MAG: putative DNA repair and recombination protein RAD54 [Streblomastix strix]
MEAQNSLIKSRAKPIKESIKIPQPLFSPKTPGAIILNQNHPSKDASGRLLTDVVLDPVLTSVLEPHQIEGVRFMLSCITGGPGVETGSGGCILADEMGVGKSLQAISLIWTVLKQSALGVPLVRKVIVVCPLSLIQSWKVEFKKWLGIYRVHVAYISSEATTSKTIQDINAFIEGSTLDVLIISYETLRSNIDKLTKCNIGLLVCDEGHRLKNSKTKTAETLCQIKTRRRVILTGTPIQNNLDEFWSMCDFVNPDALGQQAVFKRVYAVPIQKARDSHSTKKEQESALSLSSELTTRTSSFILRRTKDVIKLPQKHENIIFCLPSTIQLELYRRAISKKIADAFHNSASALLLITYLRLLSDHPGLIFPEDIALSALEGRGHKGDTINSSLLSESQRLILSKHTVKARKKGRSKQNEKVKDNLIGEEEQQIEIDEDNIEDQEKPIIDLFRSCVDEQEINQLKAIDITCSSKLVALDAILAHIKRMYPNDKVVISSVFTHMLDFITSLCCLRRYSFVRLDGSVKAAQRNDAIKKFTEQGSNTYEI